MYSPVAGRTRAVAALTVEEVERRRLELKFLLNITSRGQLEKKMENTDYDTLYHLFMVIQTKNGSYVVEKNEVIQIYKLSKIGAKTETLPVPINAGLTLNDMLSKTKSKMQGSYYSYMGSNNNCVISTPWRTPPS
jgi:hypothetical protein